MVSSKVRRGRRKPKIPAVTVEGNNSDEDILRSSVRGVQFIDSTGKYHQNNFRNVKAASRLYFWTHYKPMVTKNLIAALNRATSFRVVSTEDWNGGKDGETEVANIYQVLDGSQDRPFYNEVRLGYGQSDQAESFILEWLKESRRKQGKYPAYEIVRNMYMMLITKVGGQHLSGVLEAIIKRFGKLEDMLLGEDFKEFTKGRKPLLIYSPEVERPVYYRYYEAVKERFYAANYNQNLVIKQEILGRHLVSDNFREVFIRIGLINSDKYQVEGGGIVEAKSRAEVILVEHAMLLKKIENAMNVYPEIIETIKCRLHEENCSLRLMIQSEQETYQRNELKRKKCLERKNDSVEEEKKNEEKRKIIAGLDRQISVQKAELMNAEKKIKESKLSLKKVEKAMAQSKVKDTLKALQKEDFKLKKLLEEKKCKNEMKEKKMAEIDGKLVRETVDCKRMKDKLRMEGFEAVKRIKNAKISLLIERWDARENALKSLADKVVDQISAYNCSLSRYGNNVVNVDEVKRMNAVLRNLLADISEKLVAGKVVADAQKKLISQKSVTELEEFELQNPIISEFDVPQFPALPCVQLKRQEPSSNCSSSTQSRTEQSIQSKVAGHDEDYSNFLFQYSFPQQSQSAKAIDTAPLMFHDPSYSRSAPLVRRSIVQADSLTPAFPKQTLVRQPFKASPAPSVQFSLKSCSTDAYAKHVQDPFHQTYDATNPGISTQHPFEPSFALTRADQMHKPSERHYITPSSPSMRQPTGPRSKASHAQMMRRPLMQHFNTSSSGFSMQRSPGPHFEVLYPRPLRLSTGNLHGKQVPPPFQQPYDATHPGICIQRFFEPNYEQTYAQQVHEPSKQPYNVSSPSFEQHSFMPSSEESYVQSIQGHSMDPFGIWPSEKSKLLSHRPHSEVAFAQQKQGTFAQAYIAGANRCTQCCLRPSTSNLSAKQVPPPFQQPYDATNAGICIQRSFEPNYEQTYAQQVHEPSKQPYNVSSPSFEPHFLMPSSGESNVQSIQGHSMDPFGIWPSEKSNQLSHRPHSEVAFAQQKQGTFAQAYIAGANRCTQCCLRPSTRNVSAKKVRPPSQQPYDATHPGWK